MRTALPISVTVSLAFALLVDLTGIPVAAAWVPASTQRTTFYATRTRTFTTPPVTASPKRTRLYSTESPVSPAKFTEYNDDEILILDGLIDKANAAEGDLQAVVLETLPSLSNALIFKLRQSTAHPIESVRRVAAELNHILEGRLQEAKDTLAEFLNAGEIRKLDSAIGKAAVAGKLDAAFFNVLSLNLQAALAAGDADVADTKFEQGQAASSLQILQHINTRCQEEVEKSIPPGTALLNKLLRTTEESIRANLYRHYLTPQSSTIQTPDGKTVELKGTLPVLVSTAELVQAIADAVKQIRIVEQAGATDRESAASMVESCRNVAKEARMIIGEEYGVESTTLLSFEDGLQPVFRPASADSPYIQGEL